MNPIHFDDETKEVDEKDHCILLNNIILHHHFNPCGDDRKLPNRSAVVAPAVGVAGVEPVVVDDEEDHENLGWDLDPVTSYLTQSELRVPFHPSISSSSFQMISSSPQQNNTTTNDNQGILILDEENEDNNNDHDSILDKEEEFESSLSLPDTLPSQLESISSILQLPSIQSMPIPIRHVQVRKESIRFLVTIFIVIIIVTIFVTIRYQWMDRQSLWNQHQQLQLQFIHLQQKLESLEEQQQQQRQQQQALMVIPNQVSSNEYPNDSSLSSTTIWTTRWLDPSNGWFQSFHWNNQNCQTLHTWLENWHDIITPKSTSTSLSAESQSIFSTEKLDLETMLDDERKEEQKDCIQEEEEGENPNIHNEDTVKSTNPSSFVEFNWGFWNLDSWDISSYLWQDAAVTEGMEEEGTRNDTTNSMNLPTWQDWNDLWKNSWYDFALEDWLEPWLDQVRILLQDARWDRYVSDMDTLDECDVSNQSKENE